MENATKALIIAGAILISIVLVGVGVLIITDSKGGIDEAGEASNEVQSLSQNGISRIKKTIY